MPGRRDQASRPLRTTDSRVRALSAHSSAAVQLAVQLQVTFRDRDPLREAKISSTHVSARLFDRIADRLAVDPAVAKYLGRSDGARRPREFVPSLAHHFDLAVDPFDHDRSVVRCEMVRFAQNTNIIDGVRPSVLAMDNVVEVDIPS